MRAHPDELRAEVARLYAAGTPMKRIARALGIGRTTVRRWVDPEFHEKHLAGCRRMKESYRGVCVDCGAPTTGCNGPGTAPDRCIHCQPIYWTPERIIEAVQAWARKHGRPPVPNEWRKATPDHPATSSCYRSSGNRSVKAAFPNWADLIEAAGFPRPLTGMYERTASVRERMSVAQRKRYAKAAA